MDTIHNLISLHTHDFPDAYKLYALFDLNQTMPKDNTQGEITKCLNKWLKKKSYHLILLMNSLGFDYRLPFDTKHLEELTEFFHLLDYRLALKMIPKECYTTIIQRTSRINQNRFYTTIIIKLLEELPIDEVPFLIYTISQDLLDLKIYVQNYCYWDDSMLIDMLMIMANNSYFNANILIENSIH